MQPDLEILWNTEKRNCSIDCQQFRQERKEGEESYREYANRLNDHFKRWVVSQQNTLEELMRVSLSISYLLSRAFFTGHYYYYLIKHSIANIQIV